MFLYLGSIAFVGFVYFAHMRTKAMFAIIKTYRKLYIYIIYLYTKFAYIDILLAWKIRFINTNRYFILNFTDAKTSNNNTYLKKRTAHFGSFYLRVGAISFGIGTMVYSGLEFGQYFELSSEY